MVYMWETTPPKYAMTFGLILQYGEISRKSDIEALYWEVETQAPLLSTGPIGYSDTS